VLLGKRRSGLGETLRDEQADEAADFGDDELGRMSVWPVE
jgi:hypothetical protein